MTSPDGTSTKITRTCTITESSASLTDAEKEEIAWKELQNKSGKDKATLLQEGYSIDIGSMDFSGIKRVDGRSTHFLNPQRRTPRILTTSW